MEALQQLSSAPSTPDVLAELQRRVCGLAAAADLMRRHGLSSLLDPSQPRHGSHQNIPTQQATGPPGWLVPWLQLAVEAGGAAQRCRAEAAPELAGLAAAAGALLRDLPVNCSRQQHV